MAVVEKICSKLGPKWVLLITKLRFLTPRRRYDIEGRYSGSGLNTKVTDRAVYFKMCALDCIREWMETETLRRLDDEGKVKKLLHELQKIEDFVPLVEEVAAQEDIDLFDKSFLDVVEEVTGSLEPVHGEFTETSTLVESTTRSVMAGNSQPQESSAMMSNVAPLLSPAGPSTRSYGDEVSGRWEGVASLHVHPKEQVSMATPAGADRNRIKEPASLGVGASEGNSLRRREITPGWSGKAGSESYSDGAMGRSVGLPEPSGQLRPAVGSIGNLSGSGSGSASSIAGPQETAVYDIAIKMSVRKHKFAILDVSQRLPETKWQDIGVKLDLGEVFMTKLAKECTEERYYLMLKKWVESSEGTATFSHLRDILVDLEEDTALLVLEARLNSRGRILVRAVHHDL